jgi:hypothetical protein
MRDDFPDKIKRVFAQRAGEAAKFLFVSFVSFVVKFFPR